MDDIITIDGAGRLVIPVHLRRKHHLISGSRLRVREDGSRLLLEPLGEECPTAEEEGLLVLTGRLVGPEIDHRALREERLDRLTPGS